MLKINYDKVFKSICKQLNSNYPYLKYEILLSEIVDVISDTKTKWSIKNGRVLVCLQGECLSDGISGITYIAETELFA